jgi:hypothetical protein
MEESMKVALANELAVPIRDSFKVTYFVTYI